MTPSYLSQTVRCPLARYWSHHALFDLYDSRGHVQGRSEAPNRAYAFLSLYFTAFQTTLNAFEQIET